MSFVQTKSLLGVCVGDTLLTVRGEPYFLVTGFELKLTAEKQQEEKWKREHGPTFEQVTMFGDLPDVTIPEPKNTGRPMQFIPRILGIPVDGDAHRRGHSFATWHYEKNGKQMSCWDFVQRVGDTACIVVFPGYNIRDNIWKRNLTKYQCYVF